MQCLLGSECTEGVLVASTFRLPRSRGDWNGGPCKLGRLLLGGLGFAGQPALNFEGVEPPLPLAAEQGKHGPTSEHARDGNEQVVAHRERSSLFLSVGSGRDV